MFLLVFIPVTLYFYSLPGSEWVEVEGGYRHVQRGLILDEYISYTLSSFFIGLIAAIPTFFSAVIDAYIPEPEGSEDG